MKFKLIKNEVSREEPGEQPDQKELFSDNQVDQNL